MNSEPQETLKLIHLQTWREFKEKIPELNEETEKLRENPANGYISPLVFRGQASADWKLASSLQREFPEVVSFEDFYMQCFEPSLRLLGGVFKWDIPEMPDFTLTATAAFNKMSWYGPMARLRHHGAPSPLLDWTRSAYIAAFFAFDPPIAKKDSRVAIFSYREYCGSGKGWEGSKPHIATLGHFVSTHRRHILQQCEYTMCVKNGSNGTGMLFAPYDDAISGRPYQGLLKFDDFIQFTIPVSERDEALDDLEKMNINEYSLFETDDAMVRTVARQTTRR
jgi:hypothetical protein